MTTARRRHPVLTLLAAGLTLSLLALPFQLDGRDRGFVITSALVRAAAERITLTSPIVLVQRPLIRLEKGTILLSGAGGSNAARRSKLLIEDAVLTFGAPEDRGIETASLASSVAERSDFILKALRALDFEELSLRRVEIQRPDRGGGHVSVGRLTADVRLTVEAQFDARGVFERDGQKLDLAASGSIPRTGKTVSNIPLKMQIAGEMLQGRFAGRLIRDRDVHVVASHSEFSVPNLKAMARWLGAGNIQATGLDTLSAQGSLELDRSGIALQATQLSLDGNEASGSLALTFAEGTPVIDGTLAFKAIDLEPYLKDWTLARLQPDPRAANDVSPVVDDAEIPLVRALDADLRISSSRVSWGNELFGKGAATLSVRGERLSVNITELQLDDGAEGEAQISADMSVAPVRFELAGGLRRMDTVRAGAALFGRAPFRTVADISGRLTASGSSVGELLSSLDGEIIVASVDPVVAGLDVEALMSAPKPALQEGWGTVFSRSTPATSLLLQLSAAAGVVSTKKVVLATANARYSASGIVDFNASTLDILVDRMCLEQVPGPPAPDHRAVRIRGLLSAPRIEGSEVNRAGAISAWERPPG